MAFRFPLAAVLSVRESVEEHEQRKLEQIQHQIALTLQRIERLEAQALEVLATRERELKQPMAAYLLHASEAERKALANQAERLNECLEKLRADDAKQLQVYKTARRDREMLTEIRDEQREAHAVKQVRQDQKNLDDVFLFRQKRN